MKEKQKTKSQRVYIRKEKARIRKQFFSLKEQKEKIQELYERTGYSKPIGGDGKDS